MEKIFEIHPAHPITGVLPNNKVISDVARLPLSRAEFLRCMNFATLYAVIGDTKRIITDMDYEKALSLFDLAEHNTENNDFHQQDRPVVNPITQQQPKEEKHEEPKPQPMQVKLTDSIRPRDNVTITTRTDSEEVEEPVKEEKVEEKKEEVRTEEKPSASQQHGKFNNTQQNNKQNKNK